MEVRYPFPYETFGTSAELNKLLDWRKYPVKLAKEDVDLLDLSCVKKVFNFLQGESISPLNCAWALKSDIINPDIKVCSVLSLIQESYFTAMESYVNDLEEAIKKDAKRISELEQINNETVQKINLRGCLVFALLGGIPGYVGGGMLIGLYAAISGAQSFTHFFIDTPFRRMSIKKYYEEKVKHEGCVHRISWMKDVCRLEKHRLETARKLLKKSFQSHDQLDRVEHTKQIKALFNAMFPNESITG